MELDQWFSTFYISQSSLNSDCIQMEPNGPVRVHLVPFVRCQSYRLVWVKLGGMFRIVLQKGFYKCLLNPALSFQGVSVRACMPDNEVLILDIPQ